MVGPMKRPVDDTVPARSVQDGTVYETEIGDRQPSEAVIDVVSALKNARPDELEPLYHSFDPDALNTLCDSEDDEARPTVQFSYEGLVVTVSAPNAISVVER